MKQITKEWLRAANDDLMTIEEIIHNSNLTHITSFHAQQCVEKTLKAILENSGIRIPKIHVLRKIVKMLPVQFEILESTLLYRLDELYIESRYPGDMGLLPHGKPTLQDAQEFYEFAQDVFEKVCTHLNIDLAEVKR